MMSRVALEMGQDGNVVWFNLVYLDTGEIRQKRRSTQWLADRIFFHELRTREEAVNTEGPLHNCGDVSEEESGVEFIEGSDGEWTCSGCHTDWVCEADTPEVNGYGYCPGCGGKIKAYKPFKEESDE